MMKDVEKIKDSLIDEFYYENSKIVDGAERSSRECIDFIEKLNSADEKLDILNNAHFDFDIDISQIITQAEGIKHRKKSKIEFIMFIIVSVVILGAYSFISFSLGSRALIISQLSLITLISWSLIPISIIKTKGGEV